MSTATEATFFVHLEVVPYSLEVCCRHPIRDKLEAALSHHLWQLRGVLEEGGDLLSIRLLLCVPAWHLRGNSTTEQERRLVSWQLCAPG